MKNFPFKEIRAEQKDFFAAYNELPDKKYVIAQLPTGSGKSAIAITKILDEGNGYLITCSKALQDQYEHDFTTIDLVSLKGKDNYTCSKCPKVSCANGPCTDQYVGKCIAMDCAAKNLCDYKMQVAKANNAKIFLTNGSLMSTTLHCKTPPMQDKRNLLVFDEAHLLENYLIDSARIVINVEMMMKKFGLYKYFSTEELIKLKKTRFDDTLTANNMEVIGIISAAVAKKHDETFSKTTSSISVAEQKKFIKNFKARSASATSTENTELNSYNDKFNMFFANKDSQEWVCQVLDDANTLVITPLHAKWIFKSVIEPLANKFVFMSATIIDFKLFCETFDIDEKECLMIDTDSSFDPAKSPIYAVGSCKTAYKDLQNTVNLDKICNEVRRILFKHKGQRGIIHTGNMKISNYIKQHVHDARLLVREGATTNQMIMAQHAVSTDTVLVSSSMLEGVDLRDDLSRFQIVVKLPWLSLGDPRIKKLSKRGNWYACEMWRRLIQACGRSTRSENDFCSTYVLDSAFTYHLSKAPMLPAWFAKRVKT